MAQRKRLTDKSVAALKPRLERYEVWEGGGFGVRVSPRGVRSWVWLYRHQGLTRRLTLGTYPGTGLADARLALAKAQKALERNEDPGTAHVATRKADRQAETVTELVEDYLERYARPRKRSAAEDERILRKDVLPAWGRRKAKDVVRKDVVVLLDRIVDRGASIQANRTLAVVRRMYNWAIGRDLVAVNPCTQVHPPASENRRDRILTDHEIRKFWNGLDRAAMSPQVRLQLKFQLATAQRVGEVAGLSWAEIDLGAAVWTITAARSKNGLPHRVPLSGLALVLLEEARALTQTVGVPRRPKKDGVALSEPIPQSSWVFPSPIQHRHIHPTAVARALRANRKVLDLEDLTPHDLRRTAASAMTASGIPRLVVAKLLNHVEGSVTAVYDRHSYDLEKRQALAKWASRLAAILEGDYAGKVLALRGQ